MSEICCADKEPYSSPERLVWAIKQELKANPREWEPWTGECTGECDESGTCTCACKCDPLKPNNHCYCDCDGCACSEYVSWRNPLRIEDLSGRQ
jgi:hypothetical protein